MSTSLFRVIDANLNRLREGLRFLEEIARFVLEDARLSRDFKELRHLLDNINPSFKNDLLSSRDSEHDVGIDLQATLSSRDLVQSVLANARRSEEALRVLEEFSKLPVSVLDSNLFQESRFRMYTLEKSLVSKLSRNENAKLLCGLYPIVDTACLIGRDPIILAEKILSSGVTAIQLRSKNTPDRTLADIASAMVEICRRYNALFIVNDRVDIAIACNADGVHLGQDDLPVADARSMLGITKIIGCSIQTLAQGQQAAIDGADYLGVGPIFPTESKSDCSVVESKLLSQIKEQCKLPTVAIGGINPNNVADVLSAGADGVSVISAIMSSESPGATTAELVKRIRIYREQTR